MPVIIPVIIAEVGGAKIEPVMPRAMELTTTITKMIHFPSLADSDSSAVDDDLAGCNGSTDCEGLDCCDGLAGCDESRGRDESPACGGPAEPVFISNHTFLWINQKKFNSL
jgi:hypothetical protein